MTNQTSGEIFVSAADRQHADEPNTADALISQRDKPAAR